MGGGCCCFFIIWDSYGPSLVTCVINTLRRLKLKFVCLDTSIRIPGLCHNNEDDLNNRTYGFPFSLHLENTLESTRLVRMTCLNL